MYEIYALKKAACQAAQFLFHCVGKCQSLYNRRFVRDKRSESWREREREKEREGDGGERILGKAEYRSLCLSLSSRSRLLRVCLSTSPPPPTPPIPTLDQRRDVLWKGLNFATPGSLGVRASELLREFVNGGGRLGDDYASRRVTRRGRCFRRKLYCHSQTSVLFPTVQWRERGRIKEILTR